jgi:hypothetical protein
MPTPLFNAIPSVAVEATREITSDDFELVHRLAAPLVHGYSTLNYRLADYWESLANPSKWLRDQSQLLPVQQSLVRVISDLWNFWLRNEVLQVRYEPGDNQGLYLADDKDWDKRAHDFVFYNVEMSLRFAQHPEEVREEEPLRTKQRICTVVNALVENDRQQRTALLDKLDFALLGRQGRAAFCWKMVNQALTVTPLIGDAAVPPGILLHQRQALLVH